jgi:hypothetical protein
VCGGRQNTLIQPTHASSSPPWLNNRHNNPNNLSDNSLLWRRMNLRLHLHKRRRPFRSLHRTLRSKTGTNHV